MGMQLACDMGFQKLSTDRRWAQSQTDPNVRDAPESPKQAPVPLMHPSSAFEDAGRGLPSTGGAAETTNTTAAAFIFQRPSAARYESKPDSAQPGGGDHTEGPRGVNNTFCRFAFLLVEPPPLFLYLPVPA